jgi:hypothetical protein
MYTVYNIYFVLYAFQDSLSRRLFLAFLNLWPSVAPPMSTYGEIPRPDGNPTGNLRRTVLRSWDSNPGPRDQLLYSTVLQSYSSATTTLHYYMYFYSKKAASIFLRSPRDGLVYLVVTVMFSKKLSFLYMENITNPPPPHCVSPVLIRSRQY